MPPASAANLVANSGNTIYGVGVIKVVSSLIVAAPQKKNILWVYFADLYITIFLTDAIYFTGVPTWQI